MNTLTLADWETTYRQYPDAHILQSPAWGELKSAFGWKPVRVASDKAAAQVLFRQLPLGMSLAYVPKGPLGENWQDLWPQIDAVCRARKAVFLKVEPDVWDAESKTIQDYFPGFIPSKPIQPWRTVLVSLEGGEEGWLRVMKQKTRYNIHLAERKEVVVRPTDDLEVFHQLMKTTGERDRFGVHSKAYYQKAFDLFSARNECVILLAEYQNTPLGALMVFAHGGHAWYMYGASNDIERNRMPTYLLQWEAMRWAAAHGCKLYDLWGVPDCDEEELEASFERRSDGLWGVYRFKRGFGGKLTRSVGAWDKVYNPLLYRFYLWWSGHRSEQG
ncbi:MAG TPA: peptidoglycan bridge formation glycyltransferase FemA/FemB family protein [Longilinea sp.]|nr:peptidoglycan bridge formation glycyltransferase FemA/FemB family protein [Longilinea sp.]